MLRCRDLRQAVTLTLGLNLEEGDESADLLLDRLEPDERVELGLELRQRPRRLGPSQLVGHPFGGVRGARGLGETLAQDPQAAGDVVQWIPCHTGSVPTGCVTTPWWNLPVPPRPPPLVRCADRPLRGPLTRGIRPQADGGSGRLVNLVNECPPLSPPIPPSSPTGSARCCCTSTGTSDARFTRWA